MPEETNQQTTAPKFLNKYADRAALDTGLSELAKSVGVPVGKFENDDDAVKAYTSLSDLHRRINEKKEPPPRTMFDPATLPDDEDDTAESLDPNELLAGVGIKADEIEAVWEKDQRLPGSAYAKIRKALIKGLESKSARAVVDAFIDSQVRAIKGERSDLKTQALKVTGLSEKGFAQLLKDREKYVPAEMLGELNAMLSAPLSRKGQAVIAINTIHQHAVAKGFKDEVDAAAGNEPVSGGAPNGSVPAKKMSPDEIRKNWNAAQNGDKGAFRALVS